MYFFTWLRSQVERSDAVGSFARLAMADKLFPRQSKYWQPVRVYLARRNIHDIKTHGAALAAFHTYRQETAKEEKAA
jgi:uncharacterized protein YozE (UPF0346 family)